MRIARAMNARNGIISGFALKGYQLFAPFIIRTVLINSLGIEYLGLNSLFSSILHVLNLAELGVGSAMVFSMYKPIAEDDKQTICDLMHIYKVYYRIIGLIILVIGLAISPLIPHLIKSDLPQGIDIHVLYYLNLSATVLSYWLFAYKNSILSAHQRNDLISSVTIATSTVMYLGQFISLQYIRNYYCFLVCSLIGQVLLNICTAIVSHWKFPEYNTSKTFNRQLSRGINNRIRDLFLAKVGEVIVTSADSIVISTFLGLKMLASYNSYYFIITAVFGFVALALQACLAGIGNSLIVESDEKNVDDLKKMVMVISWIAGFCSSCLICLYQPFMEIWIGKENLLPFSCVVCFGLYFYVNSINQLFVLYRDASGIWRADRFRPIVTALTNLSLNLVLVNVIQLYGVLLSTVISILCVGMPWIIHNLFKHVFHRQRKQVVNRLLMYSLISLGATVVSYMICSVISLTGIPLLIVRLIVCMTVVNGIFAVLLRRIPEFNRVIDILENVGIKKIKPLFWLLEKLKRPAMKSQGGSGQ